MSKPTDPTTLTVEHLNRKQLARIFSKISVNKETGCWEWTASLDKGGYGRVWFNGRAAMPVHRLLFAWLVGPIPNGQGATVPNLDHIKCDNESCCNPSHLILTLPKANTLRGSGPTATNAKKTHCKRGHKLPAAPAPQQTKRECLTCRTERGQRLRSDPEYREKMRVYLRAYYQQRTRSNQRG